MSDLKRNKWMDAGDDEAEQYSTAGSDHELSKVRQATRSVKRRRFGGRGKSDASGSSDEDEFDDSAEAHTVSNSGGARRRATEVPSESNSGLEDEAMSQTTTAAPNGSLPASVDVPVQASMKTKKSRMKQKTGVIYISRIPPFMKPQTLRSYLSPYGDIGKVFLTPEDHATYIRRKRSGGNKKHSFVDGWVEFLSKKDAKLVASTLNGNVMGGKKGNYYHDDIWNIKYLTGFKWDDLTEQIARENKEAEARLRTEIAKAKRENEAFVRDVEKGKMLGTMQARHRDRTNANDALNSETSEHTTKRTAARMSFTQNAAVDVKAPTKDASMAQSRARRVRSKLL